MKKVLKSIIIALALSVMAVTSAFGSPYAINFENISQSETLMEKLYAFADVWDSIRAWSPEKYPEACEKGKNLLSELNAIKKPTVDDQLLKLFTMRCLYNQDECSAEEIEKLYKTITKKNPSCAEVHWIYGNYLSSTYKTTEGLTEMEKYIEMRDSYINIMFLEDFAYSNLICGRHLNANYCFEQLAGFLNTKPTDFFYYYAVEQLVEKSSPKKTYTEEMVWNIVPVYKDGKESHVRLNSTLVGMSLPVDSQWEIQTSDYSEKKSAIAFLRSNAYKVKGEDVTFCTVVIASLDDATPESIKADLNIIKTEEKEYNGVKWTVYTYEDKNKYNDVRKGAKGYLYTATISPKENSGLKCETPINLEMLNKQKDQSPTYYLQKKVYTRLEAPITYSILVDSCNALSKETQKFIDDFMDRAIFE